METVADVDYVVLVTEPTPFGLHDLKIAVDLVKQLQIPFGIVINKARLGNNAVYEFIDNNNIELLGEIPFSKGYSADCASGNILEKISVETENVYHNIIKNLKIKLKNWQPKSPYLAEKEAPEKL